MKYVPLYQGVESYDAHGNLIEFDNFDDAIQFIEEESGLLFEVEEIREYGLVALLEDRGWKVEII